MEKVLVVATERSMMRLGNSHGEGYGGDYCHHICDGSGLASGCGTRYGFGSGAGESSGFGQDIATGFGCGQTTGLGSLSGTGCGEEGEGDDE